MFAISMVSNFNTFFWLLVLATMVAMVGSYIKIPYALALVMTGLVMGATGLLPQVSLDPHILFAIFLPPLLFEAAINMRVSLLAANWKPVSIYALIGTLLATMVTAWLAYRLLGLPLEAALVFGALISPTDPISVIAIFRESGVGRNLSMIMEGESVFNDGVAIVLFTLLVSFAAGQDTTPLNGVSSFLTVVAGGAALGGAIGLIASRVTQEFDDHLLEIMLTTVVVFASYLSAEWLHASGVIAVVAAGLVMGSYGMQKEMSANTRLAVNSFWEYAAFAVNSMVFLLVGFEVTLVNLWPLLPMILAGFLIVLAGRAIAIYGLSPMVKFSGYHVPVKWQHMLFWGGLRGAIPMALALSLDHSFPKRDEILLLTFGVVLLSLLLQGLTTKPLLKRLGLTSKRNWQAEHSRLVSQIMAAQEAVKELDLLESRKALSYQSHQRLRAQYLQRLEVMEKKIEELGQQDDELIQTQDDQALRQALLTEKSSLREAYRNGLIDDEGWQQLSLEINEKLDALEQNVRE
ncbi:MAG TPA: Na+/H+ antiporter [Syntrophomonadaceae bacterium]|nr:Na+/H+ antiporter [Syntrophomonadaceae bacterium]